MTKTTTLKKLKLFSLALLTTGAFILQGEEGHAAEKTGISRVYVGSYTEHGKKEGKGIYAFEFDANTGKASAPRVVAETPNPSFVALTPDGTRLYAVLETNQIGDAPDQQNTGGLAAFNVDPETGRLTFINKQAAGGTISCHVWLTKDLKYAFVSNYGTGKTAAVFPLNEDGSIRPASSHIDHNGIKDADGKNLQPHGHSINLPADERFAVLADLGIDELRAYPFDHATGKFDVEHPVITKTKTGAGPRHFTFHPNGKWAYHNNELDLTVTAHAYDAESGKLTSVQTLSTVPEGTQRQGNSTAEIVISPDAKFLYVSNRGPNTLAIYKINEDGKLTHTGYASTLGRIPRNFAFDPTGGYVLAANQDSDDVFVLKYDSETGELTPTGEKIDVPMPVVLRFISLK